jgi:hypothetical protein
MEIHIFLSQKDSVALHGEKDLPPPSGVSVTTPLKEDVNIAQYVEFTLQYASAVSASVIATWLYNKFTKHGVKKIRINRTEVNVDQGEIKRILMEEIEMEN